MKDISGLKNGQVIDTGIYKAYNMITTQVDTLYYNPTFGIDLAIFFDNTYNIQFDSFYAYVTDRLVNGGVDIKSLSSSLEKLTREVIMEIGGSNNGI